MKNFLHHPTFVAFFPSPPFVFTVSATPVPFIYLLPRWTVTNKVILCPVSRGVYLAAIVYTSEDRVLVTIDDNIPTIEVDDNYPPTFLQDFCWLMKVSPVTHPTPLLPHPNFFSTRRLLTYEGQSCYSSHPSLYRNVLQRKSVVIL